LSIQLSTVAGHSNMSTRKTSMGLKIVIGTHQCPNV
jgi:hypothetical protein